MFYLASFNHVNQWGRYLTELRTGHQRSLLHRLRPVSGKLPKYEDGSFTLTPVLKTTFSDD
jgi:hypothetical protein